MINDIRKYNVKFSLVEPSKGELNTPERIEIINYISSKLDKIKEIRSINKDSIKLEVHCENGKLDTFKMVFAKKLIAYDEFNTLSTLRYNKRSLFNASHEIIQSAK